MANGQVWYTTEHSGAHGDDERLDHAGRETSGRAASIVFLDSRIPDLAQLLNGLAPGARGFVLDPDYDGVQQIAEILARAGHHDLDSLAIVAHGSPGAVSIGATILDRNSLSRHAVSLAEIGATLAVDGDLRLYACDVAFGMNGRAFVADLSLALGGVAVSASDRKVGSTTLGGTWDLDAGIGAITSAPPFTATASNSYVGVLASVLYEIIDYYDQPANTLRYELRHVNADGTNSVTQLTGLTNPQEIVIDTANNRYFILSYDIGFQNSALYSGRLDSTAAPTKVVDFSATPNDAIDSIIGLEIDTINHHLYVTRTDYKDNTYAQNDATSGIIELTYNPTTGAVTGTNNFLVTAPAANGPNGYFFANDLARGSDGVIYYTAQGTVDGYGENMIYKFDPQTHTVTPLLKQSQFPVTTETSTGDANGLVYDVEIDNKSGLVYFSVEQYEKASGNNKYIVPGPESQIYVISKTATGTTNATVVTLNGLPSADAAKFIPQNLKLDQINRILYVESEGIAIGNNSDDSAYAFKLSDDGLSATYIRTYSPNFTASQQFGNIQGLEITVPNQAPVVTASAGTTAASEQVAVVVDSQIVLSDADNTTLASARVAITGNYQAGEDVLAFTNTNASTYGNISASYSGGVLTLTSAGSTASVAQFQAALRAVTYRDGSDNPSTANRTISFTANDGTDTGTASTKTVSVAAVDDTPVLAPASNPNAVFVEGGGATSLFSGITLTDPDSPTFNQAVVVLTDALTGDVLAAGSPGPFAARYVGNTLTLTGSGTRAQLEAAIRTITYSSTSQDPTAAGTDNTRVVQITVYDSNNVASNMSQTGIVVTGINNAPKLTVPDSVSVTEDVAGAITGISFADVDAGGNGGVTATFSVASGTLAGSSGGGVTVDGTATALTLTGTIANINAFIAANKLTYTTAQDATGSVQLDVSINDGGNSGTGGAKTVSDATTINVTAVNDAPTLSATVANPTFTEGAGANAQAAAVALFTNASIDTIESGQTITGLTFTVSGLKDGANETILIDGTAVSLVADVDGTTTDNGIGYEVQIVGGTAKVILTSAAGLSASQAQALVDGLSYQNTDLDDPTAGDRTVTLTEIVDSGGETNSGADTTTVSIGSTVTVTPVNDAPTLTATGESPTFTEGAGAGTQGAAVALFSGSAVDTVESGQTITGLTLTVSGLVDGAAETLLIDGQTVTLTDGTGGTTTANGIVYSVTIVGSTARVVLSSAGLTQAQAETLVAGLAYQNTDLDNPTAGTRTATLTEIQDSGGKANGGDDDTTLSIASIVTVEPINDAPAAPDKTIPVTQRTVRDGNLLGDTPAVSDPDSTPTVKTITFDGTSETVGTNTTIAGDHGTLTLSADGTYRYDAKVEGGVRVGDTVTDHFLYTVTDGQLDRQADLDFKVTGSDQGDAGDNRFLLTGSGTQATGYDGDDTYLVDQSSDRVVEVDGTAGGIDTIYALASYTLKSNQAVEVLRAADDRGGLTLTGNSGANTLASRDGGDTLDGGGGADELYGFAGADILKGGAGADRLDGGAGIDAMTGGSGSDTYIVDRPQDTVSETDANGRDSGGTDTVYAKTDYVLADGEAIEFLRAFPSSTALKLTGNELANTIVGSEGADTITGGGGADKLYGRAGDDTFVFANVSDSSDNQRDTIFDFTTGDTIDLSGIETGASDHHFHLRSGAKVFSGEAGDLVVIKQSSGTFVKGDLDGDKVADLTIRVVSDHQLTASDFDLIPVK